MKLTATMLRKIIADETNKLQPAKKNLSESITRITEDEMEAWRSGDLGYVSGDNDRFLHDNTEGEPQDDEGDMVKSRMSGLKSMAEDICGITDSEDQFPAWVQDLIAQSHENLQHVHDYLMNDEDTRNYSDDVESSLTGVPVNPMTMEAKKRRLKMLSEGMARITEEELNAWRNGDWGFMSDINSRPKVSEAKKKRSKKKPPGLWANIHARRKAGKPSRKPGEKGYPETLDI